MRQREVVRDLTGRYGVSERRAWWAARVWRSSLRYESRRDPLPARRPRLRDLAQTRARCGYRRLPVVMRREGWAVGEERVCRGYVEEGLAWRRTRPWRHTTAGHCEQRQPATARHDSWSRDVVADQLADGRRCRAWPLIDIVTREWLAIEVAQSLGDQDVVAALARLRLARGLPQRISCDHGPECVSATMALGAYPHAVCLDCSRRGTPTDTATIDSFNGRLREECLHVQWFAPLEDAQQKVDAFRWDWNEHRPHRALAGLSPRDYAQRVTMTAADSPS